MYHYQTSTQRRVFDENRKLHASKRNFLWIFNHFNYLTLGWLLWINQYPMGVRARVRLSMLFIKRKMFVHYLLEDTRNKIATFYCCCVLLNIMVKHTKWCDGWCWSSVVVELRLVLYGIRVFVILNNNKYFNENAEWIFHSNGN